MDDFFLHLNICIQEKPLPVLDKLPSLTVMGSNESINVMGTPLAIIVIGIELIVTGAAGFFAVVTLGFAGEATRSKELTIFGWILGLLYVLVALIPFVSAVWVTYRRFISEKEFPTLEVISSPYWAPLVLLIGAAILCIGLLAFQNSAGVTSH